MTSQQKTRDDIYERAGTTWQRFWVGDNSGLYVWRAHGRTLEAWQCGWARRERITADGEVVDDIEPEYRGTVDGRLVASGNRLKDVMERTAREYMARGIARAA